VLLDYERARRADHRARVSKLLFETNHQISVGTVASSRVVLNGRELVDDV